MARFANSNSHDQSAAVWIVTFLLLSYTTLTTLVRAVVKFKMLGFDDGVAILAQLFAYGNVFSVLYALMHGFAKQSPDSAGKSGRLDYLEALQASILFYLLALAAAKVATVLFLRRIFRRSSHSHAMTMCNTAVAALSIWGIGAAIAVSVNCGSDHLWLLRENATCNGVTRWLVVAIFDGATEIGVLLVAIWLASQLQMTMKKKFTVCFAFVWRLGLIVMAAFHYRSYHRTLGSPNTDVAVSKFVIWEQVSVCYSLLSITWPFSKAFIISFDTAPLGAEGAYGSGAVTLDSAKSRRRMDSAKLNSRRTWQGSGIHSSAVYSQPAESKGDDVSFGSQEMIIRRDDEITLSYGDNSAASASSTWHRKTGRMLKAERRTANVYSNDLST